MIAFLPAIRCSTEAGHAWIWLARIPDELHRMDGSGGRSTRGIVNGGSGMDGEGENYPRVEKSSEIKLLWPGSARHAPRNCYHVPGTVLGDDDPPLSKVQGSWRMHL